MPAATHESQAQPALRWHIEPQPNPEQAAAIAAALAMATALAPCPEAPAPRAWAMAARVEGMAIVRRLNTQLDMRLMSAPTRERMTRPGREGR